MSDFLTDGRNPLQVWLTRLFPPLALLSGCDEDDTDTDTECIPDAYQQCGTDGNVHWFDSCDVEGEVVDDCDDDYETCVNTSDIEAECQETTFANVQDVAAGQHHSCAVLTSGGAKCWGSNLRGALGDGTTDNSSTPVDVSGLSSGVQAIAAGDDYTCALLESGGVKCWGQNGCGQLGNGESSDHESTPVDVIGLSSGVQAIATGSTHACALLESGGMKCWGHNWNGQLGNGETSDYEPTPVDASALSSGVQDIAAGSLYTCAVLDSGGVQCWGLNSSGQLGDGTTDDSLTPVDVFGLSSGVQAIAASSSYTCALLTSGGVMCWGHNLHGQLGNGISGYGEQEPTPVDVVGLSSGVQAIAAGYNHTCALLDSGGAMCWGYNYYGQVGNGISGPDENEATPVDVVGLFSGVQAISAGEAHTCAAPTSGGAMCWGQNNSGQLGDGTYYNTSTPVGVFGL